MKRIATVMLIVLVAVSAVFANGRVETDEPETTSIESVISESVFNEDFYDFYDAYSFYRDSEDESVKTCYQALSEAKFVETAVYLPITDEFGIVAINKGSDNPSKEEKRSLEAMKNVHVRRAILLAIDRAGYASAKEKVDTLILTEEDSVTTKPVALKINGRYTTVKTGTSYSDIMQAQYDADGYPVDVKADSDAFSNVEAARAEWELGKFKLAVVNVVFNARKPLHIKYICSIKDPRTYTHAKAFANSIKEAFGNEIVVDIVYDTAGVTGSGFYATEIDAAELADDVFTAYAKARPALDKYI